MIKKVKKRIKKLKDLENFKQKISPKTKTLKTKIQSLFNKIKIQSNL